MGRRELHLCDIPQCDEKYEKTCPFCGTECCREHAMEGSVLMISVDVSSTYVIRRELSRTCSACTGGIKAAPASVLAHLIDPILPLIKEALLAHMAESALAKEGPKK